MNDFLDGKPDLNLDYDQELAEDLYNLAKEFGMFREVMTEVIKELRDNPKATNAEVYSRVVCEWDL